MQMITIKKFLILMNLIIKIDAIQRKLLLMIITIIIIITIITQN